MNAEEKKANKLIKQHLSKDTQGIGFSYQECIQYGFCGFMEYYLQHSRNEETMSTTADYNVTIKLAQIDKQRENKNFNQLIKLEREKTLFC